MTEITTSMESKEVNVATHSYAKKLEQGLQTQRNMLILLESKAKLIDEITEGYLPELVETSAHAKLEVTERKIQKIKTLGEIEAVKAAISEKEKYYKGYMEQFIKDEEEVNLRFKHTLDIAKKSTKPNVKQLLSIPNILEKAEEDIENKIALYKQLKKHV